MTTTIFMFGYSGWGTSTREMVEAVDAVERARGFEPPMFVDIRISRAVRAKGFSGNAFERLLGDTRHRWMPSLGNEKFKEKPETGKTRKIEIVDPAAAAELLELALEAADDRRRVIFFCSCPFPKQNGKTACHRWTVGDLLLKEAKQRKASVEVAEWPGGEPEPVELALAPGDLKKVAGGRKHIPVGKQLRTEYAGLPWGSVADAHGGGDTIHRVVGPAILQKQGWALPVLWGSDAPQENPSVYEREGGKLRRSLGLEPRRDE